MESGVVLIEILSFLGIFTDDFPPKMFSCEDSYPVVSESSVHGKVWQLSPYIIMTDININGWSVS